MKTRIERERERESKETKKGLNPRESKVKSFHKGKRVIIIISLGPLTFSLKLDHGCQVRLTWLRVSLEVPLEPLVKISARCYGEISWEVVIRPLRTSCLYNAVSPLGYAWRAHGKID